MLAEKQCYECLKQLALKTLGLALEQSPRRPGEKLRFEKKILSHLNDLCAGGKFVPAAVFTKLNRKIKHLTRVPDPFLRFKTQETRFSRDMAEKLSPPQTASLAEFLRFSACGNTLDFFKTQTLSAAQMRQKIRFAIDHSRQFRKMLLSAKKLVFFSDNVGEIFFDLPLINYLRRKLEVTYIVKSAPIQNDLTLKDAKGSKLAHLFPLILGSGNDAVGLELRTLSARVKKELRSADLIIAKGMGYYETFSETAEFCQKLFYLLMTKCLPVSQSLDVPLHSYVFKKQAPLSSLR